MILNRFRHCCHGRNMQKALIVCAISLAATAVAHSETITATCYSPSGHRIDFINDEFERSDDGYSNSNPTFFFRSKSPNVLIESWQSALPFPDLISRPKVDEIVPPSIVKATVVHRTQEVLYATSQSGGERYTTTLYLNRGMGIFTRVQVQDGRSHWNAPMGAVYAAKCTFSRHP
jgi:hypothetical protein